MAHRLFDQYDADGNGALNRRELDRLLKQLAH